MRSNRCYRPRIAVTIGREISRDAVKPRDELTIFTVAPAEPEQPKEDILDQVVGGVTVAGEANQETVEGSVMPGEEKIERTKVTALHGEHQVAIAGVGHEQAYRERREVLHAVILSAARPKAGRSRRTSVPRDWAGQFARDRGPSTSQRLRRCSAQDDRGFSPCLWITASSPSPVSPSRTCRARAPSGPTDRDPSPW